MLPILREHAGHGSLVLFLGAGVAHDAGLPTWAELVAPLRKRLGLGQAVDPLDVADYFVESEEGDRAALERQVRRSLLSRDGEREPARPGALHHLLARCNVPVIFTTNFDQLTEEAIGAVQGVPPATIIDDREVGLIDETWGVTLVKLHGCVSLPRTMVLTRTDFEEYATRHRAMIAYLHALLATRTFLFVGFSLVDPNFRVMYRAIREALDGRARPAYALMPGEEMTPLLRGWARRGMQPLLIPRLEDIPAFIKELAPNEQPAPPEPLKPHLHGLRTALLALIGDARKGARPAVDVDEEVRATLRRTETNGTARRGQAISAPELLDLAVAADRLTALDAGIWVALGDVLFHQEDRSGAARAYYRALRPLANGAKLDEDEARRVRGNLARALAGLDRYSPAEWLLRRCIFRPGREERDEGATGDEVAARLDRERLARRPADAFELCYSVTRRMESSRAENRGDESLAAVIEVRDLLEALLDPPLPFARDGKLQRALRHQDAGLTDQIPSPGDLTEPQVFFLNYLGKSYRLGCTLSLDLQSESATISGYLRRANACLRMASAARPLLPYPYAHRLHLAHEPRLPAEDREDIIRQVTAELANLDLNDPDAGALIQRLRQEFPRLPDPTETPAREPTAPAG